MMSISDVVQMNDSLPRNALNRWRLARHQERVGSATECSPNVERYHQFLLISVVRLSLGRGHVRRADVVVVDRKIQELEASAAHAALPAWEAVNVGPTCRIRSNRTDQSVVLYSSRPVMGFGPRIS